MTSYAPEHVIFEGIAGGSYDDVIDELYSVVQERRMQLGKTPRVRKRGIAPGAGRSGRFRAKPPEPVFSQTAQTDHEQARKERMKQLHTKTREQYEALADVLQPAYVPIDNGRYYVANIKRHQLVGKTFKLMRDVNGQRFHYLTVRVNKANSKTVQCEVLTGTRDDPRNKYRGTNPICVGDRIRVPYTIAAKAYIRGAE